MQYKNSLEELLHARIPRDYAEAAVLQREILKEMFARLQLVTLKPQTILDAGCAIGDSTRLLEEQYPTAHIIAMDSSVEMLAYAKQHLPHIETLCAAYASVPVPDHSIDLILANLTLAWCEDLQAVLREWRRILRPNGLLILTAFGPDTLRELHDLPLAFPQLIDMHNVGDLLIQTGFKDPVLDVDYFTLTYRDLKKCWHELQVTGMVAGNVDLLQLEKKENHYKLTMEIVFSLAFAADLPMGYTADEKGEVRIPVSHLLRR